MPSDHDGTVSGLHEEQIAAADLTALRGACVLHALDLTTVADLPVEWAPPGLAADQTHTVELAIAAPPALKLRIAPLPRKASLNQIKPTLPALRVRRGLALMLEQPVTRPRMLMGELSKDQHKQLFRKLYDKYGEQAQELHVEAIFAHIPAAAAKTIQLDADLRSLQFVLPPDVSPRGVQEGYYLVILAGRRGETRNLLLRL